MNAVRVGQGIDVHAFSANQRRALMLGGVEVPGPALEGHSDADVVLHAVTDALLGAAGLGDLGELFGSADPRYEDAASALFVTEVLRRVDEAGWSVGNVDITVVAARPRLAAYRPAIARSVARLLAVDAGAVSVKATTTDGLGWTGRGEGIAALAVVLLTGRSAPEVE